MKHKKTTNKRRVVASVLSLLMVMQQSALLQAMAATSITNANGQALSADNGMYNITPDMVNKNARLGFRKFGQFTLDKGDVANFIFKWYNSQLAQNPDYNGSNSPFVINTDTQDIDTFIAAVNSGQVNINGIINALSTLPSGAVGIPENGLMKSNSHLVFVAPGGVVGKRGR